MLEVVQDQIKSTSLSQDRDIYIPKKTFILKNGEKKEYYCDNFGITIGKLRHLSLPIPSNKSI
jgi:hypothetical protein